MCSLWELVVADLGRSSRDLLEAGSLSTDEREVRCRRDDPTRDAVEERHDQRREADLQALRRVLIDLLARGAAEPLLNGERACPAAVESGAKLTCADCRQCDGNSRGARRPSFSLVRH